MAEVFVKQTKGNRLERVGGGRDLGQDVDAVLLLLDHLLQAAGLSLDPAQPLEVVLLAADVAVMAVVVHDQSPPSYPLRVCGPPGEDQVAGKVDMPFS